jgi:hypothetical protein
MLVELKERDRFMDLKFAEPDSDSESGTSASLDGSP